MFGRRALLACLLASLAPLPLGCGGSDDAGAQTSDPPAVDGGDAAPKSTLGIVVDANRDGTLDLANADGEGDHATWDAKHGAILLANLDDDDQKGAADATDAIVNGDRDVADLAPIALRAWPDAPDGTTATLSIDERSAPNVRLFRVNGDPASAASYVAIDPPSLALSADEVRAGVTLAIEARNFVTSTAQDAWNGYVDLTLAVKGQDGSSVGTDQARMRVAPLLLQHDLAPTESVFYTDLGFESAPLLKGLDPACAADHGMTPTGLTTGDQWAQDFFDVGYTSRPGPGGAPIGMKIAIRSAQDWRQAGQDALDYFRTLPDWGTLYLHTENDDKQSDNGDSLDSFGNWSVIPPYTKGSESFPLGRNVWGSVASDHPDSGYEDFVRAQAVQPAFNVDTSWLYVGHIDEFTSFVKANNARGWVLLAASPKMARDMLLKMQADGHGQTQLFVGKQWPDANYNMTIPAAITIDDLLADASIAAESQYVQTRVDAEVKRLKDEIGLSDDEIVPIPFLWEKYGGYALAHQPGTVNLLHFDGTVVIPDPFGPQLDGSDPFEDDLTTRLGALGLTVAFADDWNLYHVLSGEVHCGTNVSRTMDAKWWETGR